MSYIYIRSEPTLWTVGFYNPRGKFEPESDHDRAEDAADRCAYLNGLEAPVRKAMDKAVPAEVQYCKCAFTEEDGTFVPGSACPIHPDAEPQAFPPLTNIDGCEFTFCRDGDLEIDIRPHGGEGGSCHWLSRAGVMMLRDWLTESLK